MIDPLLSLTIALPLSLLFASAAQHKRQDPKRFAAQLDAYALVPTAWLNPVARTLPWLELAVALLLLLPASRPAAGLLAGAVLTVYALAMLLNLWRGRSEIDCGCGAGAQPLSGWLVLRNVCLAGAATLLLVPTSARPLTLADAVAMALLSTLLVLVYLMLEQLLHNHSALAGRTRHEY